MEGNAPRIEIRREVLRAQRHVSGVPRGRNGKGRTLFNTLRSDMLAYSEIGREREEKE